MTSTCIARVAVWASECGFCGPEDYYTVAIQCHRSPDSQGDNDCLCKIHNKNLPFGIFGKKAPNETLTKCSIGKGDSKFNYKAGEKMCYLFKKPDCVIAENGKFALVTASDELDNAFWKTEDYTDYGDVSDDESDYESDYGSDYESDYEDCDEECDKDCDETPPKVAKVAKVPKVAKVAKVAKVPKVPKVAIVPKSDVTKSEENYHAIPIADMRTRCDNNGIKHEGLSKGEIRVALAKHANAQ